MDTNALSQLKTVHLPAAVSVFPLALGWYFLLAVIFLGIIIVAIRLKHKSKHKEAQLEIYARLNSIETRHQQNPNSELLSELTTLLKRVAMMRYPEKKPHTLFGEKWLIFLDKTGKTTAFSSGPGQILLNVYQHKQIKDAEALFKVIRLWLRRVL